MLYHDVQGDPKLSQFESVQLQNIKSVIGVPIIQDESIWGVIIADSRLNRKEFTEENLPKFFHYDFIEINYTDDIFDPIVIEEDGRKYLYVMNYTFGNRTMGSNYLEFDYELKENGRRENVVVELDQGEMLPFKYYYYEQALYFQIHLHP